MTAQTIDIDAVRAAAARLHGVAHRTPVMRSDALDELAGNRLYLKCENFQRVGAFKFRGAYNALSRLSDDERARGVVAFSSGNHAQGVALAAGLLGIHATIVMPKDASRIKLDATRGYGAEVVTYDAGESRESIAEAIRQERDAVLIPPFDHPDIIAGQGTAALELFDDYPVLDALITPVGGGGLISGCAIAAQGVKAGVRVFGAEPQAGDDWVRSRKANAIVEIAEPATIAEGLRTTSPGSITWPIANALVEDFVTVTDEEIRRALHLLFERAKIVVEPAGAVPVAAALFRKTPLRGVDVGVIISGGNVDVDTFARLIARP